MAAPPSRSRHPLAHLAQAEAILEVRVTPKAAANRIVPETGEDGAPLLRVYVTCAPEDGKANREVIRLLAKALGVAKSDLELVSGDKNRNKRIRVHPR